MAIHTDAPIETTTGSLDEGMEGFLNLWKEDETDAETPSDTPEEDTEEDTTETPEDDTEEPSDEEENPEDDSDDEDTDDSDDDEDEEDPKDRKVLKDDSVVKIKVDGEELAVPVEKLKRLYGQEAALTRKSQEVAAKRKEVETNSAAVVAANEVLLTRAKERFAPYAEIDWLVAAKELDPEELKVLRGEAKKAYDDVQFFDKELASFMEKAQHQRHASVVEEAKATFEELSDPVKGIKGFSQPMYDEMRTFAITQGIPEEVVNNIVSAPILRVLHKAMLHEKGTKVVTKTADKRPKRIVKSRSNPETTREAFKGKAKSTAMNRLKSEGSVDAAADAFMAGWSDD